MQELLSLAPVETLCRFRRSSDLAANATVEEIQSRIVRELACNFRLPDSIMQGLKDFKAVLCGQAVVSVIEAKETYDRVEFLVAKDSFWRFAEFLEDTEHIEMIGFVPILGTLHRDGYKYALDFKCPATDGQPGTHVRVIRSTSNTPLFSVPYFFSTHLMNVITHDRLIVTYPQTTFARTGIVVDEAGGLDCETSFTLGNLDRILPNRTCANCCACGAYWRSFNDNDCATVVFSGPAAMEDNVRWRIGGTPCAGYCPSQEREVVVY